MRLAWATDTHFDSAHSYAVAGFFAELRLEHADALLISGDIANAYWLRDTLVNIDADFDGPTYFVLGNHDAYGKSIAIARSIANETAQSSKTLYWLDGNDPISLTPTVGLVGVGGWADGRAGDFFAAGRILLNDYVAIAELKNKDNNHLYKKLQALGRENTKALRQKLTRLPPQWDTVYVLTHVPPWQEAAWHQGKPSDDVWVPHFSCITMGEMLDQWANEHPEVHTIVLCGHTHGAGYIERRSNLVCWTGEAEYGSPRVARWIDI